jgi:hypothetical protein
MESPAICVATACARCRRIFCVTGRAIMPAEDGRHGRVVNRRVRNRPGSLGPRQSEDMIRGDEITDVVLCLGENPSGRQKAIPDVYGSGGHSADQAGCHREMAPDLAPLGNGRCWREADIRQKPTSGKCHHWKPVDLSITSSAHSSSIKHLGFMSKRPARFSSSSGHNMAPILIRSHFLGICFGLTGESRRNLIRLR